MTIELMPRAGIGVDRSQIRELLRLTRLERALARPHWTPGGRRGSFRSGGGNALIHDGRGRRHSIHFKPWSSTTWTRVQFVVIGAFAGRLLGSPKLTRTIDICDARDRTNLEALVAALQELHAELRGVTEPVPFKLDARTLQMGDSFTFVTDAGDFDILGTPAGTEGFEELARTAEVVDLGGMAVRIASIDSLIRMKRAAGRPKDLIEVEVLARPARGTGCQRKDDVT